MRTSSLKVVRKSSFTEHWKKKFFECRISQLTAELTAERAAVVREKETVATVRAREMGLEILPAQARSAVATIKSRIVELESGFVY